MHIVPFLSYVFVTTFTPGPNNIMSMANANKHGFFKTLKFILGVTAGFFVIMLLSSYFNLILFQFIPKIELVMAILGSIYMLYLAIKIVKGKPKSERRGELKSNSFFSGLFLQFINPKVIIYGITAISTFVIPFYKSDLMLMLFSLCLAFVGFVATSCWAVFGAGFQRFLTKYQTPFNVVMGLMLVYSAISIFI
ncbi:LysE family transporter [Alicyclobacillus curvatus]|jgi:cysteine/O-acetylserine efflux protein|nr:LysE family transporter [Alicyclobacillus curvatus]